LAVTVIALLAETSGYVISHVLHHKNLWLFNLYMLAELLLMGWAAILFVTATRLKIIFGSLMFSYVIFWAIMIRLHSIFEFASNCMILGCILMVFFYIMVFFGSSLFSSGGLFNQPIFWTCFATILYFGCDIPVMGLYNFLAEKMPEIGGKLANINTYLDIIRYPLYGVSFLLLGRMKQKLPVVV
jgi:hypothetical protein